MSSGSSIRVLFSALRFLSIRKLLGSVVGAFGVLWFVVEIGAFFSSGFSASIKPFWWGFLIIGVFVGAVRSLPRTSVSCRIKKSDTCIEIKVLDVFELNGSIVVGTNTTFDTSIEDGTINPNSLQGQFTTRYYRYVSQLDTELERALEGSPFKELAVTEKPFGKRHQYKIGTVASVQCKDRKAYFLAIASLNEYRVACASLQDILDALPKLWEYVRTRGGIEPICIPILGSRFGRVKATREEIAQEIIKSFIAACQSAKFCEKLTIAVSLKDFRERKIDLERLRGFLEYACKYASVATPPELDKNIGTPVEGKSDIES